MVLNAIFVTEVEDMKSKFPFTSMNRTAINHSKKVLNMSNVCQIAALMHDNEIRSEKKSLLSRHVHVSYGVMRHEF